MQGRGQEAPDDGAEVETLHLVNTEGPQSKTCWEAA